MSAIMRDAMMAYTAMRDEFELYRHAQYERAHGDLNGEMLNRRGRDLGVDSYSLFTGPMVRVEAFASEELQTWFRENGRVTVAEYEANWWAGRGWVEL